MIRTLGKGDLESCLELLSQLTVVGDVPNVNDIFESLSKDKNHYVLVYEYENEIIGMATIFIEQKFIHSGSRVGHIEDVVVSSEHRKLGVGKSLIERCVEIAKERDCYKVILDCDESNAPFYEKSGFKKYGVCMKINF